MFQSIEKQIEKSIKSKPKSILDWEFELEFSKPKN